jgi:single-strand DNA-binding protein
MGAERISDMGFINKCVMLGNLTRNPEVTFVPERNLPICKFGLAVNRRYKQGDSVKEDVCFIDIVAFGKTAEICGEYLLKGMSVLIEGRLSFSQWEHEGKKRSKHEIIAENVQLLTRREDMNTGKDISFDPNSFMDEDIEIPF